MMSHFLFIENEDLICKYGFHMLSRWKLVTQDRPLWLDQLCGTGRVSGVRVVRVCNIQKRKGLVYHVTFQYISHFTFLFWNPMDMVHTVHTASLQSGRPLVAASVTRLSTCLRFFFCIGNEIRHFWDYFQDPWFLRLLSRFLEIWNWDIRDTGWYWYDSMTSVFCRYENCQSSKAPTRSAWLRHLPRWHQLHPESPTWCPVRFLKTVWTQASQETNAVN